ncbi:MAG: hypothetical protein RBS57_20625 [Desulforhabdus sp.]|nr:hypothetical protein [Desulforhabdus sp.]
MTDQILIYLPKISAQELKWLALGLLLLSSGVWISFYFKRRSAMGRTVRRVRQQFNGIPVRSLATSAYFYGMERNWDSQWRGNGVLLLTEEILYFRLWARNLDLTIPLDRVKSVELSRGEGLARLRRKRFRVVYQGADDHLRAATWLAGKPQNWVGLLREKLTETVSNG